MTIEEAKAKLVDLGVVPAQAWRLERGGNLLVRLHDDGSRTTERVDSIKVLRAVNGEMALIMTIPEAEELSNALRSALYGVNCPRCTWTHSDAVPECPPQEVS